MYVKKFRHKIKSGDVALYRTLLNGWPNNTSFLMLQHPKTKAIVQFKEPSKALLVLKPVSINNSVPRVSLRHTYIAPLIIRTVKTLKIKI